MTHKVITAVTVEPVTLNEARLQCKVDSDNTTHDALLTALTTAAREYAEHYTGRALAPQTLELALDGFPDGDEIQLPMMPVASITSVKYYDSDGTLQTMDAADYVLHAYGSDHKIALAYGESWPSTRAIANAVQIRYVTGYAATGHAATGEYVLCPKSAKQAMLLHVEIESPLNPHTPAEREALERARDSLLNTVKLWGL